MMKYDIILAGVGGQGILSLAAIIGLAAQEEGLQIKQSEVHGMSQRGGEVVAHLRLSDQPIASVQIPVGEADMILSMEPLESLRYVNSLHPGGVLITSTESVQNIANYPDQEALFAQIHALPQAHTVDTRTLSRQAGSARTSNTVLVGAAARFLPVKAETILSCLRQVFASKGEKIVQANERAFAAGLEAI